MHPEKVVNGGAQVTAFHNLLSRAKPTAGVAVMVLLVAESSRSSCSLLHLALHSPLLWYGQWFLESVVETVPAMCHIQLAYAGPINCWLLESLTVLALNGQHRLGMGLYGSAIHFEAAPFASHCANVASTCKPAGAGPTTNLKSERPLQNRGVQCKAMCSRLRLQ